MKGIVFTEFLEHVGRKYGVEVMDLIIDASDLPSRAAYTGEGTYGHGEMVSLVESLSKATRVPAGDLFRTYGEYLFARLAVRYPQLFAGSTSCFEFLGRIEDGIHVVVKKIYPDAELPSIEVHWLTENRIHFAYSSPRPFARFAEGMMRGAIAFFEEKIAVREIDAAEDGTFVLFELTRS